MASWWLWSIPQTLKPVYCYDVGTHTETNKRSVARFDVNLESLVILNVHPRKQPKFRYGARLLSTSSVRFMFGKKYSLVIS